MCGGQMDTMDTAFREHINLTYDGQMDTMDTFFRQPTNSRCEMDKCTQWTLFSGSLKIQDVKWTNGHSGHYFERA